MQRAWLTRAEIITLEYKADSGTGFFFWPSWCAFAFNFLDMLYLLTVLIPCRASRLPVSRGTSLAELADSFIKVKKFTFENGIFRYHFAIFAALQIIIQV